MVLSRVLICRALAKSLAPTSPMALPLISKVWRLWLDPKALMTLLISLFSLHSDKFNLLIEDSSLVINPTKLSMTLLWYLALMFVMFLLTFKLSKDRFLANPCITPDISASKLFSLRSKRVKHLTVPMQFSRTLAPLAPKLLLLKFNSTFISDSLTAKPGIWIRKNKTKNGRKADRKLT